MTDILIRDVDVLVDSKIKELAEHQGLSREEYLRRKLKQLTFMDYETERIDKYAHLVEYMSDIIGQNSITLEKVENLMDKNNRLLAAISGGLNEEED